MLDLSILSENMPVLDKVRALEKALLCQDQAEVPQHFIQGGGIAAKTVFFKAGTLVTGAMHRFENMNIMSSGDILIVTDGAPIRYMVVDSPVIVVSPPGVKRAAFVIKDTYWTSLMPTELNDLESVEKHFTVGPEEQEQFLKMLGN